MGLLANTAPEEVHTVTADTAAMMRTAVDAALAALTAHDLKQLLLVATYVPYRNRMVQALLRKAGQEAKFSAAAREAEAKKSEIQRELMSDSAKLAALVRKTRLVKAGVEGALGAKLGRRINIQGEINTMLQ